MRRNGLYSPWVGGQLRGHLALVRLCCFVYACVSSPTSNLEFEMCHEHSLPTIPFFFPLRCSVSLAAAGGYAGFSHERGPKVED